MARTFYFVRNGKKHGPVTANQLMKLLNEDRITQETPVRESNQTEWRQLCELSESLTDENRQRPAPVGGPPPLPGQSDEESRTTPKAGWRSHKRMAIATGVGLLLLLVILTPDPPTPPPEPPQAIKNEHEAPSNGSNGVGTPVKQVKQAPKTGTLRIIFFNDTETRPLHPEAELWARGLGSFFLRGEGDSRELEGQPIGQIRSFFLYPDGRAGAEIKVEFRLTEDMNPRGSVRSALTIAIDDQQIEIYGLPLEAASGESTVSVSR